MRASIKTGDKWVTEELPADPATLLTWLREHQGIDCKPAVVVDDQTQRYYCNRADEFNAYAAKGKEVSLFYYLECKLRENMPAIQRAFTEVNDVFPDAVLDSASFLC